MLENDYKQHFIDANAAIHVVINDELDIAIQIQSKIEIELFEQLYKAFEKNDVNTLFEMNLKKIELRKTEDEKQKKKLARAIEKLERT